MWKVVTLGVILVWCLSVVDTSYDGAADYWYSNDDGVILDNLTPITLYRSHDDDNKTGTFLPVRFNTTTRRPGKRGRSEWVLRFDTYDHMPRNYEKYFRRLFTPPPLERDSTLNKLQKQTTPAETWSCSDGPDKIVDTCNHCVCVGGQLYFCTAKKCRTPDATADSCIEGEAIKSFDCNRCWCSGGKIHCTIKMCSDPRNTPNNRYRPISPLLEYNKECQPGEVQKSLDGCNTCGCNRRKELFCTALTCGSEPKDKTDKAKGCVPKTWYSLDSHSDLRCRECYCVDGLYSFCYFKLCKGTLSPPHGYQPLKLMAGMKAVCQEGVIKIDECSKCVCTFKQEWKCYTRMVDNCSDGGFDFQEPEKLSEISEEYSESDEDYEETTTTTTTTAKPKRKKKKKQPVVPANEEHKSRESFNDYSRPEKRPSYPDQNPHDSSYPGQDSRNPGQDSRNPGHDSRYPGQDSRYPPQDSRYPGQDSRYPGRDSRYPDHDSRYPDHDPRYPGQDSRYPGQDPRYPGQDSRYPGQDSRYPGQDLRYPGQDSRYPGQDSRYPGQDPRDEYPRPGPKPLGQAPYSEHLQAHRDYLPQGTQCKQGQSFTQGNRDNCQGCYCSAEGLWKCYSTKTPCRGWNKKKCVIGMFEKNTNIDCSICYCAKDAYWMCFTDEACSHDIKKSSCDLIECADSCKWSRWHDGFCHADKCICV